MEIRVADPVQMASVRKWRWFMIDIEGEVFKRHGTACDFGSKQSKIASKH